MPERGNLKWGQVYDNIYGFIRLTRTEETIINTPYFQRLRWIKQLGFANYIFAGAEHTRFAHALGVLHSADQMVRALGKHVSDEKLFDLKATDEASLFHKSIRIAALLHDIGTFPFSHSIEGAYIMQGEKLKEKGKLQGKPLPNNHEHLGSFIVKNTDFSGGITHILKAHGFDILNLSKLIKGESTSFLANQLLHSDIDADRMDYLIRDAHHTGIKYGQIDRDFILYHLTTFKGAKNAEFLAVKENALHAVEDFLIARFSWYSQVVRNADSAKFDTLATHIAYYLLENGHLTSFQKLLSLAGSQPERFFGFNDVSFVSRIQELYWSQSLNNPGIQEQMRMLLYRIPPKTVRLPESEHRVLEVQKDGRMHEKKIAIEKLQEKIGEIETLFKKQGSGKEWIIADVPTKDIIFTPRITGDGCPSGHSGSGGDMSNSVERDSVSNSIERDSVSNSVKRGDASSSSGSNDTLYSERDPVRILGKNGHPSFLIKREDSLIRNLSQFVNFIPHVYTNEAGYALLKKKKFVT